MRGRTFAKHTAQGVALSKRTQEEQLHDQVAFFLSLRAKWNSCVVQDNYGRDKSEHHTATDVISEFGLAPTLEARAVERMVVEATREKLKEAGVKVLGGAFALERALVTPHVVVPRKQQHKNFPSTGILDQKFWKREYLEGTLHIPFVSGMEGGVGLVVNPFWEEIKKPKAKRLCRRACFST